MNEIFTHFDYIYQDGHWISTATEDRRERIVRAAKIAANVGLALIGAWVITVIWFCV